MPQAGSQIPPQVVEAQLRIGGPTAFYAGVDCDVFPNGGLFVSTYGKLPSVGSPIVVRMVFPDGMSVEARGTVAFRQDYVEGDDSPIDAGFGVRFDDLAPEVRAHIARYVKASPPMFREP